MSNIEKELKEYLEFKNNYDFVQKIFEQREDGVYCDGFLVYNESEKISESEAWINVGYKLKGLSSNLSNLYPYEFTFRGKKFSSIEGFFQGIKFPDKDIQECVFSYFGMDAVNLRNVTNYDWMKTGEVYFDGKCIDRNSEEYNLLVDELYISAVQNPLYRMALLKCDRPVIHSIGNDDINSTVFTRYEFEYEINSLKDYLQSKEEGKVYKK